MNFRDELNDEQYAAVTAPDGPTLVIAAAGTGKTRTLTYRLAYLVLEKQVQPREVLLLTFTNKAAKEMITRAEELIEQRFNSSFSGTFHSFANRLLRSHAPAVGFGNDFTILDADDAKKMMRACIDELDVDKKHFPKPDVLLSLFGVVSGRMGDLSAAVDDRFEHSEVDADLVLKAHARYQERKREANTMDFDDLLIYAHKVLADNERVRHFYQDEFKYVLVDEYQDTNTIQAGIVNLLVQTHRNLMVVGDDFQSIYSWRGADFRNFLDFEKAYPGAQSFKLQTNYRSTPEILEVANEVIAGNPDQFQKDLVAVRDGKSLPRLAKLRDGSAQARYVIEKAKELHRKGIAYSDICVLYRSHFHAMELQMELARAQLPYIVTSGVRFFEQAHVKDVCTLLHLLVNPSNELAFSRLIEMLPRVGQKSSHKIFKKLGGRVNLQQPETHEKLLAALPKAAREDWEKIMPIFLAYREEELASDPGEIIFRFNKAFYTEYMVENFDNHKFRAEDLDGLIDFTVKFEDTEAFLSEIALLTNLDADGDKAPSDDQNRDSLRLSTVHQAKGLEWKAVFILFANEDMFPSKKAIEDTTDAEERRLFYVAVTRAEDELFLCTPMVRRQRDGSMFFLDPSRFISEIPSRLLRSEQGAKSIYNPITNHAYPEAKPKEATKPGFRPPSSPLARSPERDKKETVEKQVGIQDFTFSNGSASVTITFSKEDLPNLRKSTEEKIDIRCQSFGSILNSLKKYLAALPDNTIKLKLEITFSPTSVKNYNVIESELEEYLKTHLNKALPSYIISRLEELAPTTSTFVNTRTLLKEIEDLSLVESDAGLIKLLSGGKRHAKQVNHLAKEHLSSLGPINIATDNSSLLSLLEGSERCYFVWEIFDDDRSTYLWESYPIEQLQKDPTLYSSELERILNEIDSIPAAGGRNKYKAQKHEGFSHFNHDNEVDGFETWVNELKQHLGWLF